jgi:hypothetical protein
VEEVLGDLHARLPAADDEHRPCRQLARIPISGGVQLEDRARQRGGHRRHTRHARPATRDHDRTGLEKTLIGGEQERVIGRSPIDRADRHPFPHRKSVAKCVALQTNDELRRGRELVGTHRSAIPRQPVHPRRAVERKPVPALRPPRLADPVLLEHHVLNPARNELTTHPQPRLTGADDDAIDVLYRHALDARRSALRRTCGQLANTMRIAAIVAVGQPPTAGRMNAAACAADAVARGGAAISDAPSTDSARSRSAHRQQGLGPQPRHRRLPRPPLVPPEVRGDRRRSRQLPGRRREPEKHRLAEGLISDLRALHL